MHSNNSYTFQKISGGNNFMEREFEHYEANEDSFSVKLTAMLLNIESWLMNRK